MECLEIFHAQNNLIGSLNSEAIKGLENLLELYLQNNLIQQLPSEVGHMTKLQSLDISNNSLKTLPKEIGLLKHLIECKAKRNKIEYLPIKLGGLNFITSLDLSSNCLEELPHEIGILRSLQQIDVSKNNLKILPESLGAMFYLRKLLVSKNRISQIPDTFSNLIYLQTLDLSMNKLQKVNPLVIKGLSQCLKHLDLSSNIIQFLPKSGLIELKSLEILSLKHNMLRALPLSFLVFLDKDIKIDLSQNPFDAISLKHSNEEINSNFREWLYAENEIYDTCCLVWDQNKNLYLTCKKGLGHFMKTSLSILGHRQKSQIKLETLSHHMQSCYVRCKDTGVIPHYHEIDDPKERISCDKDILERREKRNEQEENARTQVKTFIENRRSQFFDNLDSRIRAVDCRIQNYNSCMRRNNSLIHLKLTETISQKMLTLHDKKLEKLEKAFVFENMQIKQFKMHVDRILESEQFETKRRLPLNTNACWK